MLTHSCYLPCDLIFGLLLMLRHLIPSRPILADTQYSASDNTNEPYLTWIQYLLAQESLPHVISTSYGDDEQTVPSSYATQVCTDLAKLGTRGVTLLYASGDSGADLCPVCHDSYYMPLLFEKVSSHILGQRWK